MGKKSLRTPQGRRMLALGMLTACVGAGAFLHASAPGQRGADTTHAPAPTTSAAAIRAVVTPRVLPALDLAPAAHAALAQSVELTALARYDDARARCRALISLGSPNVVTSCVAPIDGLTGRYEVARHSLEAALPTAGSLEQQRWLYELLGELAYWNGDLARAEQALGAALALEPGNRRVLLLHLDLLLDTGRARQALGMLAGQQPDDALLLRAMLAYQKLGLAEVARDAARQLEGRIHHARLRGTPVATRDEARFHASLPGHEERALELARAAFAAQQEPWDARILLEAALHARAPKAAEPVLGWLARNDFEAPGLRLLVSQLGSLF